jgi:hypothetical protein
MGVPAERHTKDGSSCRNTPESSVFPQKDTITVGFFPCRYGYQPCTSRIQPGRVTGCINVLGPGVGGDIIKNISTSYEILFGGEDLFLRCVKHLHAEMLN